MSGAYYVYRLVDPRSGRTFYVGKGKGKRARDHAAMVKNGHESGNSLKDAIIADILRAGLQPFVIIESFFTTEAEAFAHEKRLICALRDTISNAINWRPVAKLSHAGRSRHHVSILRQWVMIWNRWGERGRTPGPAGSHSAAYLARVREMVTEPFFDSLDELLAACGRLTLKPNAETKETKRQA